MIERRETSRRRVCLGGLVRPAAFLPDIACTLGDVSLDGARIRPASGTTRPHRFDLLVPCRGEARHARVIWRDGDAAGLAFEDARPEENARPAAAPKTDGVPDTLRLRSMEGEAEVARLRSALPHAGEGRPDRPH